MGRSRLSQVGDAVGLFGADDYLCAFEVKADAKDGPLTLAAEVEYQVCNDSVCFPAGDGEVKFETSITPPAECGADGAGIVKGWDPARFATIAKPVAAPAREKVMILGASWETNRICSRLRRRF